MGVLDFWKKKEGDTGNKVTIESVLGGVYIDHPGAKGLDDLKLSLEECGYVQFVDVKAEGFEDARFVAITERTVMIDRSERTVTYKPKKVTGLDNIPDGSIDIYINVDDLEETTLPSRAEAEI